jgi:fluoride exporter
MTVLLVALGGAAGSVGRYLLGALVNRTSSGFPVGTLVVNVLGCALAGLIARLILSAPSQQRLNAALIVGFCGGFTTFSAFSLETAGLITGGEWPKALAYMTLTLFGCLVGTGAAFLLARGGFPR